MRIIILQRRHDTGTPTDDAVADFTIDKAGPVELSPDCPPVHDRFPDARFVTTYWEAPGRNVAIFRLPER
jgi:hypothetical protein